MNKKSRKRAFFVYVVICLLYLCVTFRLAEKVSMERTTDEFKNLSKGTILPVAVAEAEERMPPGEKAELEPVPVPPIQTDASPHSTEGSVEPSLLISIPFICHAIKEGWLEREGLIFTKKDAYNNVSWKKPVEILTDHDEEGIQNILTTIGKKRVVEFMRKEGIGAGLSLTAEELILGKGYSVDAGTLVSLYDRYVSVGYDDLFPFSLKHAGIMKTPSGFRLTKGTNVAKESRKAVEAEWLMPNLTNLPMRVAIQKLSVHTSKIKVYGTGYVMNQSPRALERLKGEWQCTIQGRSQGQ